MSVNTTEQMLQRIHDLEEDFTKLRKDTEMNWEALKMMKDIVTIQSERIDNLEKRLNPFID